MSDHTNIQFILTIVLHGLLYLQAQLAWITLNTDIRNNHNTLLYLGFDQQNKTISCNSHDHLQSQHSHHQPLLCPWPQTLHRHSPVKPLSHWETAQSTVEGFLEEPPV